MRGRRASLRPRPASATRALDLSANPRTGAERRRGRTCGPPLAGARGNLPVPPNPLHWSATRTGATRLLDLDRSSRLFQLALDRVGLLLGDALLDRLGGRVDEVLRLLQAEAGDRADDLDHLDLLVADRREHDVERRLLLDRGAVAGR